MRSLLRSHSQGERSRASLAPGLYHPSPSIFSPSWSDRQGAVDDGAITGLRMRRSSAVRRPTPCHFSSLSSLLVHSSLFFRPTHGQVCRAFAMDYDYIYDPMHRREGGQYDISSRTRRRRLLTPLLLVLLEPRKLHASHVAFFHFHLSRPGRGTDRERTRSCQSSTPTPRTSSPGSSSPLVASIWTSGTPHGM